MSFGILPVFQPELTGTPSRLTGEALLAELEVLEDLADECELVRLSSFADNREIPEDFEGDPDELLELLGPFTDWFSCDAGRDAVTALLGQIEGNEEYAEQFEMPDELVAELKELRRLLEVGAERQVKFRLELSE